MAGYIVTACALLHNLSLGDDDIEHFEDNLPVNAGHFQGAHQGGFILNEGQRQRHRIVIGYFNN